MDICSDLVLFSSRIKGGDTDGLVEPLINEIEKYVIP